MFRPGEGETEARAGTSSGVNAIDHPRQRANSETAATPMTSPGGTALNLSGAQRPHGPVDREPPVAPLDVHQDEEVMGVPVVRRSPGAGGLGVEAEHQGRRRGTGLPGPVNLLTPPGLDLNLG